MSRNPSTSDAPTDDSALPTNLTDPAEIADRPDVEHSEHTFVHADEDHCEAGYAGRSVVGVVHDGDVLAHVDLSHPAAVLPNGKVEPGDDYVTVGEAAVEEHTGVPVRIETPVRVRTAHHRVEGADEPFETTRQVLFRAVPTVEDPAPEPGGVAADQDGVSLTWLSELPAELADESDPAVADIERVLNAP